ncbi:MAG: YdcF family protein [Ruminococcaceae bacterium]|nr:YdcF family protein [Oscillospiraceae bacterium]
MEAMKKLKTKTANKKSLPPKIKGEKTVRITGYICGTVIFLMFFSYLLRQFVFPEGTSPRILAVLVSACSLLPLLIYPFLRKKTPRLAFILLCVYTALALFFLVTFVIHLWDTLLFPAPDASIDELDNGAILLVFGSKVQGTNPARPLAKRLDRAAELMEARPDLICIVTGGQGDDEIMPEGEVMRNYLIAKGIPEERIIAETEARNTIANIDNSKALITKMGLEDREVACVSTSFHIPRIKTLMRRAGFGEVPCFSADSPTPASLVFSLIREYCSRAKILFGN